ncbi:MAG: hypothetical protein FD139_2616 [Methylocystaceae bacterium]|uniref:carbonic anhydrase n=1 Tax=Methylocystis sp. (strain SC2) TaxID=187303 RepID=UPI00027AEB63|nr:carbonic anhydrase [Methylocystis sp. SC2]KAF0214163.1 MAG: hypothetical protein FD172_34 [Methylocystaceae bacterium]TXT43926.1 MAG: hypothetical protein FD139_2616 [Methylocystaceae bacterium]CCJ06255.1 Uncharacterized protein BN69_0804 [Methylocystis sp. SC2]
MCHEPRTQDFHDLLMSLNLNKESEEAEVLLLTCIDFRFFQKIMDYIDCAGLRGKFDHVILAGAELGPVVEFPADPKPHWKQFFIDHLALSKSLHNIKKVLVLGHRDCGAYKMFKLLPDNPDLQVEHDVHRDQATKLEALIKGFCPNLEVEWRLLELTFPGDTMNLQALS